MLAFEEFFQVMEEIFECTSYKLTTQYISKRKRQLPANLAIVSDLAIDGLPEL